MQNNYKMTFHFRKKRIFIWFSEAKVDLFGFVYKLCVQIACVEVIFNLAYLGAKFRNTTA